MRAAIKLIASSPVAPAATVCGMALPPEVILILGAVGSNESVDGFAGNGAAATVATDSIAGGACTGAGVETAACCWVERPGFACSAVLGFTGMLSKLSMDVPTPLYHTSVCVIYNFGNISLMYSRKKVWGALPQIYGAPPNPYWQASQSGSVIEQAFGTGAASVTPSLTALSVPVWIVDFSAEVALRVRR